MYIEFGEYRIDGANIDAVIDLYEAYMNHTTKHEKSRKPNECGPISVTFGQEKLDIEPNGVVQLYKTFLEQQDRAEIVDTHVEKMPQVEEPPHIE